MDGDTDTRRGEDCSKSVVSLGIIGYFLIVFGGFPRIGILAFWGGKVILLVGQIILRSGQGHAFVGSGHRWNLRAPKLKTLNPKPP